MSDRANMGGDYPDYGYASHGHPSGAAGVDLARAFVAAIQGQPGITSIADLGCGNGYLAAQLGALGYRVTGIDASASGIAIATRHYASDTVSFLRAAIDPAIATGALAGERFDAVISSDVIEHLYRPAALPETAAALLKPGGLLLVGTPYHGYLKNLAISLLDGWDAHHGVEWDGGHIKFFSVRTLGRLVEGAGFTVLGFRYHGRMQWLWKNMICVARKTGQPATDEHKASWTK